MIQRGSGELRPEGKRTMKTTIPAMWSAFLMEETPEQMVQTMLAYGYNSTELSDEHARQLLERGTPAQVGGEFRSYMNDLGFSTPQGHLLLDCDPAEADPDRRQAQLETFRRWFELFHALGVRAAVLHPAGLNAPRTDAYRTGAAWERTVETLEVLLELTRDMSFTICLENLPYHYTAYDQLASLIRAVRGGERLGICLDTGHLALNGGDCAAFVHAAGSRLKALHITDCVACTCGGKHDHFFPTAGCIDWAGLVAALRAEEYHGLFNYEVPRERECVKAVRLLKLAYSRKLADTLLQEEHGA